MKKKDKRKATLKLLGAAKLGKMAMGADVPKKNAPQIWSAHPSTPSKEGY